MQNSFHYLLIAEVGQPMRNLFSGESPTLADKSDGARTVGFNISTFAMAIF